MNLFTQMAVNLLKVLGFIINLDKSVLTPTQVIMFPGFTNNSIIMRFSLPSEKVTLSTDLFNLKGSPSNPGPTSGSFEILSPAVWQALFHFRYLQALLIRDLNQMNQLQGSSFIMLSDPRGNQLVATESRNSQWLPNYNTIFKSDNIHRYLFVRLGSCLWKHQNQWEVVCQRDTVAYKCCL